MKANINEERVMSIIKKLIFKGIVTADAIVYGVINNKCIEIYEQVVEVTDLMLNKEGSAAKAKKENEIILKGNIKETEIPIFYVDKIALAECAKKIEDKDALLVEKDALLAEKDAQLREYEAIIASYKLSESNKESKNESNESKKLTPEMDSKAIEIIIQIMEAKFEAKLKAFGERLTALEAEKKVYNSSKRRVKHRTDIYKEMANVKSKADKYSEGSYKVPMSNRIPLCVWDEFDKFCRVRNIPKGQAFAAMLAFAMVEFSEMEIYDKKRKEILLKKEKS